MSLLLKILTIGVLTLAFIAIILIIRVFKLVNIFKVSPVEQEVTTVDISEGKMETGIKRKNPAYAFGIVVILVSAFFTFFANTIPQVEYHPPEKVEIAADLKGEQLAKIGKEIFEGKGSCLLCHTINGDGLRAPDLAGVGEKAPKIIDGYSSEDYLFESLYFPPKYVVEGYTPSMPPVNKPPSQLSEVEIAAVVAFLQSMGGEITVTAKTIADFEKIGTP